MFFNDWHITLSLFFMIFLFVLPHVATFAGYLQEVSDSMPLWGVLSEWYHFPPQLERFSPYPWVQQWCGSRGWWLPVHPTHVHHQPTGRRLRWRTVCICGSVSLLNIESQRCWDAVNVFASFHTCMRGSSTALLIIDSHVFMCLLTDSIHHPDFGFRFCLPPWSPAHLHWATQVSRPSLTCNVW